jgi:hypothetical protein
MANVKISALPAAITPLAGTEVLPIVQSGVTRKVSVDNLTLGRPITASSITDSALTSGRVTYAGLSGLLQDSANLLFNGTTLTANTLNLSNALGIAYGGTGQTSFAANQLHYGSFSTSANLTFNGTILATTTLNLTNALGIAYGGTGQTAFTTGQIHFGSFSTSANLFWDNSNTRLGVGTNAPAVTFAVSAVDAMLIPNGTTAQRPTGAAGYLRFNSTTSQFEGYNGTAWASVGGAAISNDTATSTNLYPLFANATSGTALTVYTSNAKLLYKPSTGELTSPAHISSNGLSVNANTVSTSYSIPASNNAVSVGPITVASGQSVTVPSGSRWVVL